MRFQYQTSFGGPDSTSVVEIGNCYATCIANMLDLDVEAVPNFCINTDHWYDDAQKWLRERGLMSMISTVDPGVDGTYKDTVFIAVGISPRGYNHAVLWKGGKLLFDPHPKGGGIKQINEFEFLAISDMNKFRRWATQDMRFA